MLILVRHGRTPANAEGLLQGRLDQDLDEVGRRQANAVAAMVGDVDRVISSPMRRATQTAETFGLPVEIDERWIEIAYGEYEGTPAGDPSIELWHRWIEDPAYAPAGGGESMHDLDVRVRRALADLEEPMRDQDIVVVSHVSPIKAATAWALNAGTELAFRTYLAHASVCRIGMGSRGPVLRSFNETAQSGEPGHGPVSR